MVLAFMRLDVPGWFQRIGIGMALATFLVDNEGPIIIALVLLFVLALLAVWLQNVVARRIVSAHERRNE